MLVSSHLGAEINAYSESRQPLITLEHWKIYLVDACRAGPIKQARKPRKGILPVSRESHNGLNGGLHHSLGAQSSDGRSAGVSLLMAWDYIETLGCSKCKDMRRLPPRLFNPY